MPFFVYILQSQLDNSYYIGFSNDPNKRLLEHNSGKANYTKRKVPWEIVYTEEFQTKREALIRERFLKRQKNTEFYQKLITMSS